jgi:hypothetical protein
VAVILFVIAYEDGGYGLASRAILAIALWWTIIVSVGLGLLPRARPSRAALVVGGLLAGYMLWTLASTLWAPSPEDAFNEFNRASAYLAVYAIADLVGTRRTAGRWADGIAIAIAATGAVGLSSRLFPHLFSTRGLGIFLPYAVTRLSFPVGYWNGLGVFVGLGFPLLLRIAVVKSRSLLAALALVPLPALAAVIYLTSSRGGVVTAVVGTGLFVVATDFRWRAFAAVLAAFVGSALAVGVVGVRHTLVNGPLTSGAATSQGRSAVLLIAGCCILAGAILFAGDNLLAGRLRPGPAIGRAVVAAVLLAVVVGAAFSHPVRRFDAFKRPLATAGLPGLDPVQAHLLSGSGSGRWQFWSAAVREFEQAPLHGGGAGSYQSWWARHASFTYFLKNAHSLYLETMAELGVVGLLLIVGAFTGGVAAALRRLRSTQGEERVTLAALLGAFVAFAVAAGIDWMWQLTVVGLVGVVSLALLAAGLPADAPRSVTVRNDGDRHRSRLAVGLAGLGVAWALICAQAIPWLASTKIADSQAAIRRGDPSAALKDAADARSLQPWAASPYLQLALVAEQTGDLRRAREWIASAISRDKEDWRVWLVASRLQRESGRPQQATLSYRHAAELNPRSPLFASGRRS